VFESNGPDIQIRGTASTSQEKYVQLARRRALLGDQVAAENFISTTSIIPPDRRRRRNKFARTSRSRAPRTKCLGGRRRDSDSFANFGQQPGFVRCSRKPSST